MRADAADPRLASLPIAAMLDTFYAPEDHLYLYKHQTTRLLPGHRHVATRLLV